MIDLKDECTTSSAAEDDAGTSGSWGYAGRGVELVDLVMGQNIWLIEGKVFVWLECQKRGGKNLTVVIF